MRKIIHIIPDLSFGGAGQYLFHLLKFADLGKYEVEVICHGKGQLYEKLCSETDFPIHLISETTGPKSFSWEILKGVYQVLKRERPQVVHVHASLAGRLAARLLGIKVVMTKHWKQKPGNKLLNGLVSRLLSDEIVAISQSVADSLTGAGVPGKMITVVHNGIDLEPYQRPAQKNYRQVWGVPDRLVVGMVARMEPEKDHATLLRAARWLCDRRDDLFFVLVGKGTRQAALEAEVKALGLEKQVLFTGFLSDVRDAVEAFDISVLTSVNEAFGLVLAESMALGKPVVATDLDSIREVVGDAGLFFQSGQDEELARQLQLLLEDRDLSDKLGALGKERVEKYFDARQMVKGLEQVYEKVWR